MKSGVDNVIDGQRQQIESLKIALRKRDDDVSRLAAELRATKEALTDVVKAASGGKQVGLHDFFAGQALVGLLAGNPDCSEMVWKDLADHCFEVADAMLEVRGDES